MNDDLQAMGRDLAETQDAELAARDDLARVRSRLLSPARQRRSMTWVLVPMVAAAVAIVAAIVPQTPPALTFTHQGQSGAEGAWVTSEDSTRALRFSDGSVVDLAPRSGVRIAELSADGARLDLQRGELHVQVVHREQTQWQVQAGPFAVHVVGTEFDVSWDPSRERFALHLDEGRVRISGPTVAERFVEAGETVRVDLNYRRMEVVQLDPRQFDPAQLQAEEVDEEIDEAIDETIEEIRDHADESHPSKTRRIRIDWRRLAEDGRHDEAVAAADWDRELAQASANDLMRLANAARLANQTRRAKAAYLAVRARHAGTGEAANAAYFLARAEMDARRYRDAALWFEHAIAEAPEGTYAMVARGRLMQAYRRGNDPRRARRSARVYLEVHPTGPHAARARNIVGEQIVADPPPAEAWGTARRQRPVR